MWVRLSIFSQLSIIQYVGLCVFSLPISFVMIERIYILCLIIIIKSEVWTITHCLGLGHETMVCAVCLSIFLWRQLEVITCSQPYVATQALHKMLHMLKAIVCTEMIILVYVTYFCQRLLSCIFVIISAGPDDDVCMCNWTGRSSAQVKMFRILRVKALLESMLTYCQLNP